MVPFLKQTARYLIAQYGDGLADVCIILPNRRGGLFLRKYLGEEIGKVSWAPVIYSIEDFIAEISGLQDVDNLSLLFELFEVHREIEGVKAQSFEEFLRWAPQLLSDFNEVDRYLADAQELFATLTEARAISLWNLDNQPLTEFEKKYLHFYQSLYDYYARLTQRLIKKNQAYQGLAFRHAAGMIEAAKDHLPWRHLIFAGFNALTKAEETIIETLKNNGQATLLWDADHYYIDNKQQEAGDFLRVLLGKWATREPRWISDDFATGEKRISIIGAPDPIGQVKYCGNLLHQLAIGGKSDEKTAVILLDEGLLVPLLNSIPDEVESMNITAGLALKQTPMAGLFETVFQLHLHTTQFSYLATKGIRKFYYRDVLTLLQHPYIRRMAHVLTDGTGSAFEETIENISAGHRIFIGIEDLVREKPGLLTANLSFLNSLLTPWDHAADAVTCFKTLIENLRVCIMKPQTKGKPADYAGNVTPGARIDLEYLFAFSKVVHQLGNLLTDFPTELKLPAFYQLYSQEVSAVSLPFYGEPLKGVQIMGMLESRTLDFENLIILSCNEDLLPSGKINASFIPFDIKQSFDLPTYRHKDSVYAYHFYRLLQRAGNVWILYNTEPEQLGGGDRSRFLRQILHELPEWNPKIVITESILSTPPGQREPLPVIEIAKTGKTIELMKVKAGKGFSATSLNAYRNCTLKFYFSEIAGIREPEDMDDTIDPAILGSVVHEALHSLFEPYTGQPMTSAILAALAGKVEPAVDQAFGKKFNGSDIAYGKNLLFVNVAKLMIKRFLHAETAQAEDLAQSGKTFSVEMLEQYIEKVIPVPFGEGTLDILLKGFIDRVDIAEGSWKIIDYKTGTTEPKQVKVQDWDELFSNPDLNIAFQLLTYGFLLNSKVGTAGSSAGIISLKRINNGFTAVSVPGAEPGKLSTLLTGQVLESFEKVLLEILAQVYNLDIPFSQTDDPDICEHCPYINLCGR
ncbi:MAG: PD-(D/E)XK nuclease family protein [Bacteroidota bacterium]